MKWVKWNNRSSIPNKREPGVYFIALSEDDISGKVFSLIKEIIYIGVSVSKKGVANRLYQLEKAMEGKDGIHGGAERVRYKHIHANQFFSNVYVAVCSFPLKQNEEVFNWRQKAECLKHEYVCIADYLKIFGELPEFNDQKRSRKK